MCRESEPGLRMTGLQRESGRLGKGLSERFRSSCTCSRTGVGNFVKKVGTSDSDFADCSFCHNDLANLLQREKLGCVPIKLHLPKYRWVEFDPWAIVFSPASRNIYI